MCRDRLTKREQLASLIPDVILTCISRTRLNWGEKLKIAEELLDKCVIIVKNEQFMPRPITRENSSIRKCCPELIEEVKNDDGRTAENTSER